MNKSNKILVGVLAFVVVCVVGYALFSENITVTGTATAKGNFKITASCTGGVDETFADFYTETQRVAGVLESGYNNDFCNVNGNTVSFGANLLYPSAQKYYTIRIKNTGTIDAQLNLASDFIENFETCYDSDGDDKVDNCYSKEPFSRIDLVGFVKSDGTKIVLDSEEASKFFNEEDGIIKISSGEEFVVIGSAFWDDYKDTTEYNNKLWKTTRTVIFNFKQVTAQ